MFGKPIPRPFFEAIILPFVWTYIMKEDPITGLLCRKSRATCNGDKKYGKAVTVVAETAICFIRRTTGVQSLLGHDSTTVSDCNGCRCR